MSSGDAHAQDNIRLGEDGAASAINYIPFRGWCFRMLGCHRSAAFSPMRQRNRRSRGMGCCSPQRYTWERTTTTLDMLHTAPADARCAKAMWGRKRVRRGGFTYTPQRGQCACRDCAEVWLGLLCTHDRLQASLVQCVILVCPCAPERRHGRLTLRLQCFERQRNLDSAMSRTSFSSSAACVVVASRIPQPFSPSASCLGHRRVSRTAGKRHGSRARRGAA